MYNKKSTTHIRSEVRKIWAEKTFELTNIGAGVTLFSQFVSDKSVSWTAVCAGLILVLTGYINKKPRTYVRWFSQQGKLRLS